MEIVVSTRNKHKLQEISQILSDAAVQVVGLDRWGELPEIEEDGTTFAENASKKAWEIARRINRLTVADDSGLEVAALDGQPGVYSARFSGAHATYESNNARLLALMQGMKGRRRRARFVCCVAIADREGIIGVVEGECRGMITEAPVGTRGFGYDPVFYYPPLGKTFAELAADEKNALSHRAKAFMKAKKIITAYMRRQKTKRKP